MKPPSAGSDAIAASASLRISDQIGSYALTLPSAADRVLAAI